MLSMKSSSAAAAADSNPPGAPCGSRDSGPRRELGGRGGSTAARIVMACKYAALLLVFTLICMVIARYVS
jgi:hypothetical protein